MKAVHAGFLIVLSVVVVGCVAKNHMQCDLIGHWSSTAITYPNDPVFANTQPDTTIGSAAFLFEPGNRFTFRWNDAPVVGDYHVSGDRLVLSGDDGESTACRIKRTKNQLIIVMDDGFVFELKKDTGSDQRIKKNQ